MKRETSVLIDIIVGLLFLALLWFIVPYIVYSFIQDDDGTLDITGIWFICSFILFWTIALFKSVSIISHYVNRDMMIKGTPGSGRKSKKYMKQINYIDLGLPSGTLWADRNLGADKPEDYGDYFRFGETIPFTEDSPKYVGFKIESEETDSFQGCIAGTEYDAATVILGENYRIPTINQVKELQAQCNWEWIELITVCGMKVTGPNGNSIFLPASGWGRRNDSELFNIGTYGYFWSSTCWPHDRLGQLGLFAFFEKDYWNIICNWRAGRLPIRAIAQSAPLSALLQNNKLFMMELCDKLNKCIPCKNQADVDELTRLLQDYIDAYPDRKIYWSNKVYLNSGCNQDHCQEILLFSGNVLFVPSDYPQERLGVKVCYKYEIEENPKGN